MPESDPEWQTVTKNGYRAEKNNHDEKQKKLRILEDYKFEKPRDWRDKKLDKPLYEQYKRKYNHPRDKFNPCIAQTWCNVKMPINFNYAAGIMRNNVNEGLLHTLIRHYSQWINFIPEEFLFNELERFPTVKNSLKTIQNAETDEELRECLKNFMKQHLAIDEAIDQKEPEKREIIKVLSRIQEYIHTFISESIKRRGAYLGEAVNEEQQVQVQFKVEDLKKNTQVMFVCVGSPPYPNDDRFSGDMPLRIITTIFFNSEAEAKSKWLRKVF